MSIKKIMLHCPCQFTKEGLLHLFRSSQKLSKHTHILNYSTCSIERASHTPDIIILVMDENISSIITLLNLKETQTEIVLLSPHHRFSWINRYLAGRVKALNILDMTLPLSKLKRSLVDMISRSKMFKKKFYTKPLSQRELYVIVKLLYEKSAHQIAKELGIDYKTVCAHKRNALIKLGANSLNEVIALKASYQLK